MPIQQLPASAPDFTLDHILGHKVSLSDYKGKKVVVTFGGRESAGQIEQGIGTIRKGYDADELTIIGVSDLRAAPRPARIIVKNQIKKAYEGAGQGSGRRPDCGGQACAPGPIEGCDHALGLVGRRDRPVRS